MTNFFCALILAIGIGGGCDTGGSSQKPPPSQPPQQVTIADPVAYLAQSRACDGNLATPLRAGDAITCRRTDIGRHKIEDLFLLADGSAITSFDITPFGAYAPEQGDGGEQYVIEGNSVRAAATKHGGEAQQWFVGSRCGGHGWFLFKTDATDAWKSVVARLSIARSPDQCPPLGHAFTRYALRTVAMPRLGNLLCIVSEHYDAQSMERSSSMEQFFLCKGWGRVAWQAFGKDLPHHDANVASRCPDFGWARPPVAGWHLRDCRIVVNVEPADGKLTGGRLWHP